MSRWNAIADEEHKLEMTPMIDVTFLLLIFFLCTLKIRSLEGRLGATLPRDVGAGATPAEPPEPIEIATLVHDPGRRVAVGSQLPWNGSSARFDWADRRVAFRVGPQVVESVSALGARLAALHGANPERPVVLRTDAGTIYADVVGVLDAVLAAGFAEVRFAATRARAPRPAEARAR